VHTRNDENANDGMVNGYVWDKKPCLLNKTEEVNEWLSRQLALCDRRHSEHLLSRTHAMFKHALRFSRKVRGSNMWAKKWVVPGASRRVCWAI